MSDPALLDRFRRHYRGGWRPEDALAWLDDPTAPGPSGAPGPAREVDRMRLDLYRLGTDGEAVRRHHEAAGRLDAELAEARAALDAASPRTAAARPAPEGQEHRPQQPIEEPEHRQQRARTPLRAWLPGAVAAAVAAAGGLAAAVTAPLVVPPAVPPPLAFVAPATTGTPVWATHGVGSLPSSPVLEAPESPVIVALACRGRGAIHVLVDQQDRRVPCAAGRVRQDIEYFTGHHGRFTVALSASGPVAWMLTVTAVVVE